MLSVFYSCIYLLTCVLSVILVYNNTLLLSPFVSAFTFVCLMRGGVVFMTIQESSHYNTLFVACINALDMISLCRY